MRKSAPQMTTRRSPRSPEESASGQEGPRRADARRNRGKLLRAARDEFASDEGRVSLDGIARAAGVGIGTLYRHFPTREALVEAVFANELDDLTASGPELLEQMPPDPAMREWARRYARFATTKRGMLDTLRASVESGHITASDTRERLTSAIASILTAGRRTGDFRTDIEPDDVTALLLGVSVGTKGGGTSEQTGRLLDLIVDSLHPRR